MTSPLNNAVQLTELQEQLSGVKVSVMAKVINHLVHQTAQVQQPDQDADILLLNHVGPAAAGSAVEYALARVKQKHNKDVKASQLIVNNKVVRNLDCSDSFSGGLREYLLPRVGGTDFDAMIDVRRRVDYECGHPRSITPFMYWHMYMRDDTASRVVDIYPDECAAASPEVYDDPDEKVVTEFEASYKGLNRKKLLNQAMYRLDKLSGVGHYGILLVGINDSRELDQPVQGIDDDGNPTADGPPEREVLYFRPLGEYHAHIAAFERNTNSPRFGQPTMYNIAFEDVPLGAAGVSVGTRTNLKVHWHRVVHVADNTLDNDVFGTPRQQQVFDRLLDNRKIKGGSAEMIWQGGFPGIAFEVDPQFVADSPEFDRDAFKADIKRFADGFQRYIDLVGIKANTLSSNIANNPDKYVRIQLEAIALAKGVPLRIFMGSEEAKLASSEDKITWNGRVRNRLTNQSDPRVIRAVTDRLLLLRVLRKPKNGDYFTHWPDLNAPTDDDKSNLALKWTQALSQYVASGVIHMIKPMDYMVVILGLDPPDAKKILDEMGDGLQKLLKVDPSQGAGVNGVRTDQAAGAGKGPSQGRARSGDRTVKKTTGNG